MTARDLIELYALKTDRFLQSGRKGFPHLTEEGSWRTAPGGSWTGGFWVGQLLLLWQLTGEERFRQAADRYLAVLEARKDAAHVDFDLGFLYRYSFALAHELTRETRYRTIALEAADRLATLFHARAGVVHHRYPHRMARYGQGCGSTIIDVMMNLSLLWWATRETKQPGHREKALAHALRTRKWLIRPDGSTHQLADFDLDNGGFLRHDTHQGRSPQSCWSRGQAWGIHGFLMAHLATRRQDFLRTTRRLLAYWADRVPEHGIPPWDFEAPEESLEVLDTSAAAIVCAAAARAKREGVLLPGGDELLDRTQSALLEKHMAPASHDGVLRNGCHSYPAGSGVGGACVWGDYFLLETMALSVG